MTIEPVQIFQLLFGTGAVLALAKLLMNIGAKMKEQDHREERLVKIEKAQEERSETDQMCKANDKRIAQLEELRVTDIKRLHKIELHFSNQFPRVRSKSRPDPEEEK